MLWFPESPPDLIPERTRKAPKRGLGSGDRVPRIVPGFKLEGGGVLVIGCSSSYQDARPDD